MYTFHKIKKPNRYPFPNRFQIHSDKDLPIFVFMSVSLLIHSHMRSCSFQNWIGICIIQIKIMNSKMNYTLLPLWEFQQKVIFSKKLERQTQENIEMKGILDLISKIVKISWFLCLFLFLIFLSGSAPYNFFFK